MFIVVVFDNHSQLAPDVESRFVTDDELDDADDALTAEKWQSNTYVRNTTSRRSDASTWRD